ncbi:KRI1-like family-domain-containing protein [Colletotrichum phormii]|uniref:KRI1-like family-domain-containing protein n=1 Tax=Colletotrichum phormii TaxID=359342 RepID=A0AAI9ZXN7_9PEZI|nr:KRI1-like family-domain-containing protein [Colletotrichum phormii]KAK1640130.1 KRI1-like family-domain-containing protein [Colletotrichum phormii]
MAPETKKEKAPKRVNLLDDSDSDNEDGGADIAAPTLKVNEEFARRFEHNKKREELHRLEEKFKKPGNSKQADDDSDGDSSSSDETEDEDGFLATEDLDAQISATLNAIKNKDPRVLDSNFSFFQEGGEATPAKTKKEKPMFLKDYHREKILAGGVGASDDEDDDAPPQTYNQEQDALKKSIISEINKAADGGADDEDFVQRKPGQKVAKMEADGPAIDGVHPARAKQVNKKTKKQITEDDIKNADRDPELFLSNFMAARAWTEGGEHNWKAFDSDDGEGDDGELYDKFEAAYNLRFEDPDKSNAALKTYSREIVSARSVRKEAATSRRKQRDAEKEKKEAKKAERKEEKARLRKLKLEEAEEKLKKIKHAAGLRGEELKDDEWLRFLNDAWDDDRWESEMKRRFGEDYYAEVEGVAAESDDEEEDGKKKKSKPKKPMWDDDIDINDIIPDFKDDTENPQITLSNDEATAGDAAAANDAASDSDDSDSDSRPSKKRKTQKGMKKDRLTAKKASKLQRAKLEALVDAKMDIDAAADTIPGSASLHKSATEAAAANETPAFRYRETSPQAFGMTARDILLAPSDAALNSFAGLKKLATFRDQEKKRKDKKRLGKKARLRQWRREHFGEEFERTGPTFGLEDVEVKEKKGRKRGAKRAAQEKQQREGGGEEEDVEDGGAALDGGKKRKRSRGKKKADEGVVTAEE